MECKYASLNRALETSEEIIETYWNVNFRAIVYFFRFFIEIIETYWNVNQYMHPCRSQRPIEIIETYWNVNVK